ncbi:MAG: hypothetical protein R2838_10310 [Caldilineaceae bacterium]
MLTYGLAEAKNPLAGWSKRHPGPSRHGPLAHQPGRPLAAVIGLVMGRLAGHREGYPFCTMAPAHSVFAAVLRGGVAPTVDVRQIFG